MTSRHCLTCPQPSQQVKSPVPKSQEGLRLNKTHCMSAYTPWEPLRTLKAPWYLLPDTYHYIRSTGRRNNPNLLESDRWRPGEKTAGCWHTLLLPQNQRNGKTVEKRNTEIALSSLKGLQLSLVDCSQSHVNLPGAKAKKGGAHTCLYMHMFNTFTKLTKT